MKNEPVVIPDYYVPLLERVMGSLVQPVPEELAMCEFDCSAVECAPEKWANCPRRLSAERPGGESRPGQQPS